MMSADTSIQAADATTMKTRQGIVIRAKMQKTVVVEVTRRLRHRKYVKFVTERKRFFAHDETNACNVGDRVILEETRPMSKNKRWRVKEVIQRSAL